MSRRNIARFGAKGRSIRVFVETGNAVIRVQWRERGRLLTRSWANTLAGRGDAKAFARGLADRRIQVPTAPRLTLRDIWRKYVDDRFQHLRPRSQALYLEYWRYFETMWGRDFVAEDATRDMLVQLRKTLDARGLAVTTVGEIIRTVKRVYRWAEASELIARNRLAGYEYRVAKEKRPVSPAEYRDEEFAKLLAAFRPELASQWRAYVLLAVCGYQGVRQNSALHLQWADVDLEAGVVMWRARWDKQGREWSQPLRQGTIAALAVARDHRARDEYTGPWIFPPVSAKSAQETYSQQSFWGAIRAAETRASILHRRGRAAHGLRRLLAGEVNALTGDPVLALHAIGDTDVRQAQRYLKQREDRVRDAFAELDRVAAAALDRNATATRTGRPNERPVQVPSIPATYPVRPVGIEPTT